MPSGLPRCLLSFLFSHPVIRSSYLNSIGIPASTSICRSQIGKHVGENLTQVRYPVACLRVIDRCYWLLTQGGTSWRLSINDVQAWMFTKERSWLAQTRWMPMERLPSSDVVSEPWPLTWSLCATGSQLTASPTWLWKVLESSGNPSIICLKGIWR